MKGQALKGHLDLLVLADRERSRSRVCGHRAAPGTQRRGVRSAGGDGLPGVAPPRRGRPTRQRVGGVRWSTPPDLPAHGRRPVGAGPAAEPMGAVHRSSHGGAEGSPAMAEPDLIDRYLSELRRSLGNPGPTSRTSLPRSRTTPGSRRSADPPRFRPTRSATPHAGSFRRFGFGGKGFRRHTVWRNCHAYCLDPRRGRDRSCYAVLWLAAAAVNWWASDLYATWTQERYVVLTMFAGLAAVGTAVVLAGMLSRAGKRGRGDGWGHGAWDSGGGRDGGDDLGLGHLGVASSPRLSWWRSHGCTLRQDGDGSPTGRSSLAGRWGSW